MFLSRLFKRKSTKLLTLFGALTMALGVGATIFQTIAREQNEVVETKATDTTSSGQIFYLEDSGNWFNDGARLFLYCFGNGDSWFEFSALSGTSYYFTTVTSGYTGMIVCRNSGSGSGWGNRWNQTENITSFAGKNLFITGNLNGNQSGVTQSNLYKVTTYKILDSGSPTSAGTQYVKSGELPSLSASGYTLDGWYANASTTTKTNSVTSNMSLYARFYRSNWCFLTGDATFLGSGKTTWNRKDAIPADNNDDGNVAAFLNVAIVNNSLFQIYYNNATNGNFEKQDKFLSGTTATSLFTRISDNYGGWNYKYSNPLSTAPENGFKVYMTKNWANVVINYDVTITLHDELNGTTKTVTGNSDIVFNPSGSANSHEGYTASYYSDSGHTTPWGSSKPTTTKKDVYVVYTLKTYDITYRYVVDGVLQDKDSDGNDGPSGSYLSVAHGTKYKELTEPTFYGASFDGWYSNAACSAGISDSAVTSSTTIYAKFSSDSSSTPIYADVPSTLYASLLYSNYLYVKYWNGSTSSMVKLAEYTSISVDGNKFYRAYIPSDATGFRFTNHGGSYSGNDSYKQTIDFAIGTGDAPQYNNSHNLIVIGNGGGSEKRNGTWTNVLFYLEVSSSSTFATVSSTYNMSVPENASTGDLCQIMGVNLAEDDYVRVKYIIYYSGNTVTKYHGIANAWNDATTGWEYIENYNFNKDAVTYYAVHIKKACQINLYVVGSGENYGRLYFVDCSGVVAAGYLYVSTQLLATQIKIQCTVNSVTKYSGAKVSTVTAVENVSNLGFGGVLGMIKIPFFNLKGSALSNDDVFAISLTSALDNTKTVTINDITIPAAASYNCIVVLNDDLASWSTPVSASTDSATINAANVSLDIAKTISSASNSSVCTVEESTAKTLCYNYDNITGAKAKLESNSSNYYIKTWNGALTTTRGSPVFSGTSNASFKKIRYELGLRTNDEDYKTSNPYTLGFFHGTSGSDSPLTMTLWIVLGAGMAGLAAIGAAYFVSKKKRPN